MFGLTERLGLDPFAIGRAWTWPQFWMRYMLLAKQSKQQRAARGPVKRGNTTRYTTGLSEFVAGAAKGGA